MGDVRFERAFDANMLPSQYYVIGDEAFSNTTQFLTPWSGTGLGVWKDSFNYHLSSMRQCIERAFGLLTSRWGVFWRPLSCAFKKRPLVITVAALLHNYCIDLKCPIAPLLQDDIQPGDIWEVIDNNQSDDPLIRQRAIGNRRWEITDELQAKGKRRPDFAACNNRIN